MAGEEKQRRTPNLLLTLACVVVVIAGLKAAQSILVPFTVAVFLAILGFPPLFWLQQRKVPTAVAVLIVLLAMVGTLALVGTLVSSSINSFIQAAPQYEDKLNDIIHRLDPLLQRLGDHQAKAVNSSDSFTTLTLTGQTGPKENVLLRLLDSVNPNSAIQLAVGTLTGLAGLLSNTLLVMLTLAFMPGRRVSVGQSIEIVAA